MARSIAGLFHDRGSAEQAIADLKAAGFDASRIGIVTQDKEANKELAEEHGTRSTEGAVTGGIIGGSIGALLAAAGALVIPGIGPFISGGILATSVVGGAAGWLVGGLAGLGIPKEEAEYYEGQVQQGRTLVTVDAQGRDAEARSILLRDGAEDLQDRGFGGGYDAGATTTAATPAAERDTMGTPVQSNRADSTSSTEGDIRVPVVEEELVAAKRQTEEGRVHIHKDVIEEQQSVSVPVQRETVHVERVAVTDQDANVTDAFVERDIDVPLVGEEVVVGKRAHVVEEVRIHKDQVTENEQVTDTVRRERVVVDGVEEPMHSTTGTDVTTGTGVTNSGSMNSSVQDEGIRTASPIDENMRASGQGVGGAIRNAAETVKDKAQGVADTVADDTRRATDR